MGDAENARIKDFLSTNSETYDFIKIPYHGNYLKRLDDLFKDCFKDFYSAIKIKPYAIAFFAVVIAFVGFIVYTSKSFVFAPHMKKVAEINDVRKLKGNPYRATGNILGDKNGKVIVYLYSDFQCPACSMFNIIIHKAAKELKNVKVIHKNFPLDSECNKDMKFQMHPGSCLLAKYAIASGYQNKYWNMTDILYSKKPKTELEILEYAKKEGINIEKLKADVMSQKVNEQLQAELKLAKDNKLNATPSLQVGLRIIPGVTPYSELEKILLDAGAKRR